MIETCISIKALFGNNYSIDYTESETERGDFAKDAFAFSDLWKQ